MDKALDSVPHQMSRKDCDDCVTSATRSLMVDKMLENAWPLICKRSYKGKELKKGVGGC